MKKTSGISKKMIAEVIIDKLIQEGKSNQIRTSYVKDYLPPEKIQVQGKDETYVPDVKVLYDNDEANLYEIQLDDNIQTDKWKILSTYANKQNGNLYVVAPDWLRNQIKKELIDNEIHAKIIYFETN